jgi:P-type Ca2+ transporter type 2C
VSVQQQSAPSPWYAVDVVRALEVLGSAADRGLSTDEANRRFQTAGANVLPQPPRRSVLRLLIAQFADVLVLLLIGAAIVASIVGEPEDIVAIVAIVVLNAVLGFVQAFRAERAIDALRAMSAPVAHTRRDGRDVTIDAAALVPGDVVILEAGARIPADLRLIETRGLAIEEAALTGESVSAEKTTEALDGRDVPLGDRHNMAFTGTSVSRGRGVGVVVATGIRTQLGRIAVLLRKEEEVETPLQQRLSRLGKALALAALVLCTVIIIAGLLRGEPPVLMLMTGLSLAVAAIPEALPALVTMSLALGARRMAKQQALVRRLAAVETLGSVTVICSDKTGTLTENRMRVEALETADGAQSTAPLADAPSGSMSTLLELMALNNDVAPERDERFQADATELALYRAAEAAGFRKEQLANELPRIAELPFSSERGRMTTIHRHGEEWLVITKGAPERVIPHCVDRATAQGAMPLDHQAALLAAEMMAESGLRVLAFALRRLPSLPLRLEDAEERLTFAGIAGLLDPPRAEVERAVAMCQSAGIRVVMITGDHPATARAVAARLGIATDSSVVMTGRALAELTQAELEARVRETRIYARVAPEDKIRIVKALQREGECVAMTGDGVNDAPALRRAEIGVAMGRGGTDVAREAAQMVLLDDNFATIVSAVAEGRRIYDNLRRFVRYILSTNSGELWTLFLAPFVGLPLPLLPVQILWMNLVTDGLPGLSLAVEPPESDVMRRPPRAPQESIFAHGLWQHMIWVGVLMAALALGTQAVSIHMNDANWRSMTFTVLTLSQLAHVMAIRSERESLVRLGLWSNRPLLGAVAVTIAAQMAILYVPAFARVFNTTPLTLAELLTCVALSSVVLFAVEVEKWLIRRGRIYR